ncbi:MAG TPA: hypothetical protein VH042_08180 [Solirubrobacterales bacterium]|jgi:hypothetical protein|nr:hypothetical protein [Solirubrobacterales bacterium]
MKRAKVAFATMALVALGALAPAAASADAAPAWALSMTAQPTNFAPGTTPEYVLIATNVGAKATSGTSKLEVELPKAWKIANYGAEVKQPGATTKPTCTPATPLLTCETSEALKPGRLILVHVQAEIPLGETEAILEGKATVTGGGASEAKATVPTPVQGEPVPFGFLPGFSAPITGEDGAPVFLAGSHPYQQEVSFGFPTKNPGDGLTNDGHPRDFSFELPRGLVGSPAATPVLCTEAQLTLDPEACPDASQVGLITVVSIIGEAGHPDVYSSPLYNMVPPPGSPAELAFNVGGFGVFVHILANVRSDGDYGIEASTRDVIAFGQQPIFSAFAQLFGTPSAQAHDSARGENCPGGECQLNPRSEVPLLTLPSDCPGKPMLFKGFADTWEEPSPPFDQYETSYESADLAGSPVSTQGCGELEFDPTIEARPTTNLTDSPTGLDVELKQTQGSATRASAPLRDLSLRLPAGLTVNPSQASGLAACSESQIGFKGQEEGSPHFFKTPQSCPDAAKLGTFEATSPLLVARNEAHEVLIDPETGKPKLETLHGSVYLADPLKNPFGSLVAIYLVIEDEKTGIVAKLAGEGELDPQTGQITTYFKENPELPLEDVKVHIFGGSRGALITPPTCGTYTAESEMVPWSTPQGKNAFREASFQTSAAPGGGPCPTSEAQLPNAPKLTAGTELPSAGKYSPLLFKLSREDGTQRLAKIEATLPTGLLAKLAGVGECSEAGIAKARSREEPEKGALEQADPSCPASSQIGVLDAAAGAGPTPYRTTGKVYLAGPYKGAPLSTVIVTPAIAGPFDLGTVVVRAALYLDPETSQGRIVTDPLPTILHGVPLDLRSAVVRADRPSFTINPTSCDEKSFGGTATSTLGQMAPLFQRFQVGGCKSLPYKPKLSVRLKGPIHRGGHPSLRAVFTAKPGEANTAAISFTFPKSEFIDQAHFRTICTRVQFAAGQCPAGSVYGHVVARSPLVDYPLEGPAYLRSSSHKLPDLVFALHGPASQPIAFNAVGRVDSVNGGLRVRFESIPDAPLSKVIVTAQGAKKGLFQNSTNICKGVHRATLKLDAQSGKVSDSQPKLVAQCKGKSAKKKLPRK